MNYAQAKQAINIITLWAELRDFVANAAIDPDSPMTRKQALAAIDSAASIEANYANPRFDVFEFMRREMKHKVCDGGSMRKGHPEISKWMDVRLSVLADNALQGAN